MPAPPPKRVRFSDEGELDIGASAGSMAEESKVEYLCIHKEALREWLRGYFRPLKEHLDSCVGGMESVTDAEFGCS